MKETKVKNLIYISLSIALLTVCSWITLPLIIPITLQTMAVCIISGLLGVKKSVSTVLLYLLIGSIGVPVFSGFRGGINVLFGVSGGYIIGFILTAFVVGIITERFGKKMSVLIFSMLIGIALCYIFGTFYFMHFYTETVSIGEAIYICVIPFLIPEVLKIFGASLIVNRLHKVIK